MLLIIGEGGRRRSRITDMSSGTPDKSETSSGGALAATDSEAWAGTEAAGARAGGEHRTIGWVGFCEGDKGGDLPTATCFSNENENTAQQNIHLHPALRDSNAGTAWLSPKRQND